MKVTLPTPEYLSQVAEVLTSIVAFYKHEISWAVELYDADDCGDEIRADISTKELEKTVRNLEGIAALLQDMSLALALLEPEDAA